MSRPTPPPLGTASDRARPTLDFDGPVARIALGRHARRNPLSTELCEELIAVLCIAAASPARIVVLDGGEAFCSGEEIAELADPTAACGLLAAERQLIETLVGLEQLTIAVVDGYALGGGLEITLACDFVIASRRTLWGLPHLDTAAGAGWDAAARISCLAGPRIATELALIGALHPARRAADLGLWNRVVDDGLLERELDDLIAVLLEHEPRAAVELKLLLAGQSSGEPGFVPAGPPPELVQMAEVGGIGAAALACASPAGRRDFWVDGPGAE